MMEANEANGTIKVLVVDDSLLMSKIITDILSNSGEIEVVATARNGVEALEKVMELSPDVITLDIEMPVMDGLTCLKEIMRTKPTPVIMLSSLVRDGSEATIKALEIGAVDFVPKPANVFEMEEEQIKSGIIQKIINCSKIRIWKKTSYGIIAEKSKTNENIEIKNIVAIGISTGGPRALHELVPSLPGQLPCTYLIIQHMPSGFTRSLARRLDSMSQITVKEAQDGDVLKAGTAYIAPGDCHMLVERHDNADGFVIKIKKDPPVRGHRPSIDTTFKSLSETGCKNVVGVIMTGMGSDGVEGLKVLKSSNNAHIIAQDEKSCIVYGMPRAAIESGVVDTIAPLEDIHKEIIKVVGGNDYGYESIP